ncbi:unnamed protein product, partial [Laminaria digitata]
MRATTAVFHAAMTAFGDQHSVVIGTAGGSVVKCNADSWEPRLSPTSSSSAWGGGGGIAYGRSAMSIEPGHSAAQGETGGGGKRGGGGRRGGGNGNGGGRNNGVSREFFERHRHPVVFVGFRDVVSLTMVTLDVSGLLCVWPYGENAFSGFGWYTPSE